VRVTNTMLGNTILKNISAAYARIERSEDQLSSGKLYRQPSDNPVAINQALGIRVSLKETDQYLSNISDGLTWLNTADTALKNSTDLLQRAKELAVAGANGTNTQSDLNAMAAEVDQLLSEMVNVGNTNIAGRYIFGGNQTTIAPFSEAGGPPPTAINYNGDSSAINYETEKGVNISVNLPGDSVFKGSTDVFQTLITLRDDLLAGNYAAVSADTSAVDDALGMITDAQMVVGAKLNRLEMTQSRLEDDKLGLTKALSGVEDADLAEVITRLKMDENVYQAALMAGSTALQKSLIDFLR